MSDNEKASRDGGDISSGHGETQVRGPVSDEKAEQMLHGGEQSEGSDDPSDSAALADTAREVADPEARKDAPGGNGGGGW